MKARVNGWTIEVDVVRALGSNPHAVDVDVTADHPTKGHVRAELVLSPAEAEVLGGLAPALVSLIDDAGSALRDCAKAGTCDRCPMPCDPGDAYCPTCEEAQR